MLMALQKHLLAHRQIGVGEEISIRKLTNLYGCCSQSPERKVTQRKFQRRSTTDLVALRPIRGEMFIARSLFFRPALRRSATAFICIGNLSQPDFAPYGANPWG